MDQEKTWRNEKRHRDGSIKIINGKIYARIQYLDEITGKRKEKLKQAPNKTKAKELIKEMRKELNNSQTVLESDKISFSEVAEKYRKIKLVEPDYQNGIKVSGKRSFKNQIYLLKPLMAFYGKKPIRSIKPSDLESYKTQRLKTKVVIEKKIKKENPKKERRKFIWEKVKVESQRAIASVNRELSLLRQIFVFAEAENLIIRDNNPFARVKKLISTAAETQRDRILSRDEETLLLTACETSKSSHLKPLLITAVDTGMRKGELLKLVWDDVDLVKRLITVKATNTKTEKMRMVPMTGKVKEELSKLWQLSSKNLSGSVFGISSNFERSWKNALKKTGIIDFHFHDLRHTAITRMIRVGVPASEAMKISGHLEMKTFQRYVNLTQESVTAAADLLDKDRASWQSQNQINISSEMSN